MLPRSGRFWAAATCVAVLAAISEWTRPDILLVGNVTVDVFPSDGSRLPGGAVTYAWPVISAFGSRACLVTAAGPDADLSSLRNQRGLDLVVVPTNATLTFEHTYTFWGSHRRLRVTAQPGVTLQPAHVPARCRRARAVLLGPLMPDDLDAPAFVAMARRWTWLPWVRRQQVGLMAQGLQRGLDAAGRVVAPPQPSYALLNSLGPQTWVFLSDVETDAWQNGTAAALARQTARFLVTRGGAGADEMGGGQSQRHPPFPVDAVVDTNGAGDSFATAYMLGLAVAHPSPAALANWAGGMAVTQRQACKPACVRDAIRAGWASMPPAQARVLSWAPLQRLARGLGLAARTSS